MRLFESLSNAFAPVKEVLSQIKKNQLPADRKGFLRERILASIQAQHQAEGASYAVLIERLKKAILAVVPAGGFRVVLREKMLTLAALSIRNEPVKSFGERLGLWLLGRRRFVAASLVAFFFLSTVFYSFGVQVPATSASYLTLLEEVSGNVIVFRDGASISVAPGFLLKSNDIIRTDRGAKAVVRFLDQSVSRLDESTEVKISQLFVNPSKKSETVVEVVLTQGRLWSRVVSLIDNFSRFQVKAANTVTVAKRKAAFDVSVGHAGKAKVAALHNRVEVTVATPNKVVETTLVKGFSAEVKSSAPVAPQIAPVADATEDQAWIAENLSKDEQYIAEVKREGTDQIKSAAGISPGSPLYPIKAFSSATQIAFTLSDVERQKKLIGLARGKFAQAELLLENQDTEGAAALLREFSGLIAEVTEWMHANGDSKASEVFEIQTLLNETLALVGKQLSLVLPTDPLYPLKDAIGQATVATASGPQEQAKERLEIAATKLLEAHDLAEQGDTAAAQRQVEQYSATLSEVASEVVKFPEGQVEKAVSDLIDAKVEDIKALEVIATAGDSGVSATPQLVPLTLDTATSTPQLATPGAPLGAGTTSETVQIDLQVAASQKADLDKSITEVRTEAITKLGEVVLEAQKQESAPELVEKIQQIKRIEVNGKSVVNLRVSPNQVLLKTPSDVISIVGTSSSSLSAPAPVLLPR